MTTELENRLSAITKRIEHLESSLPKRNDPASVSLKAKIPFKVLDYREVLIWRFTELCRCALENFKAGHVASAIILTRAALETVAALWYLNRKVKSVIETQTVGDVDEYLMRLLLGSKTNDAMPEPINVLTFVQKVDKEIGGFLHQYEQLSEFSHPNWAGTYFLYSQPNTEKIWADFGKDVRNLESVRQVGTINLEVGLMMFEHSYNQITDMMPAFIQLCERELEGKKGNASN